MACLFFDILCPAYLGERHRRLGLMYGERGSEHEEGSPFFTLPKLEITHPCSSGKGSVFETLHYIDKAKEVSLNAKGNSQ